jgi:hypothetical protein
MSRPAAFFRTETGGGRVTHRRILGLTVDQDWIFFNITDFLSKDPDGLSQGYESKGTAFLWIRKRQVSKAR